MTIINDFVVKEEFCNMQCKYCLTKTSLYKQRELVNIQKTPLVYKDGSKLKKNMDDVTALIFNMLNISILKISGGEIFLVNGILDYIKKHAPKYKKIQILTNGILLTPYLIDQLKKVDNICIQISIDHHTLEGNLYRTPNFRKLRQILKNLDILVQSDIMVEINCVLHDKNTHMLCEFCDYLMKYRNCVILLPFPIRGKNKDAFLPKPSQFFGVEELINRYTEFEEILPPKIYLEYLLRFLYCGRRENPCILPKVAVGSFDNGDITPCANYWFTSLGNILNGSPQAILQKVNTDKIYNILTHDRIHPVECTQCFTPWEILNLYALGEISVSDIKKIPLYDFDGLEEALFEIREEMMKR